MSDHDMPPREPSYDDTRDSALKNDEKRAWKICKVYVHAHLIAIPMCAWSVYLDSPPHEGALYDVSMYLVTPALILFAASPWVTLCIVALSLSFGRKYLLLGAYDAALTVVQFVVMFPAYS